MPEGTEVVDLDEIDELDDEPAADIDPKLKTAIVQKQKYRTLAVNPATGKTYKSELEALQKANGDKTASEIGKVTERVDDITLVTEHKLDKQDLTVLKGLASTAGKTPAEILADKESDAYKAFDTYREGKQAKATQAAVIPEPTDRTPIVEGKSFAELDAPAKQTNYAKTIDTLVKKGRGQTTRNLS
jgi:hypothetical protein